MPAAGQFVRLRRAANIASGGTPVAVFDHVHPDNRQLAIRAAQALRLDFAGVDLLIPDIARSWREGGAAICEVNAQPTLGQTTAAHLYVPLLGRLVPGRGRIPVVGVIGPSDPSAEAARALAQALATAGLAVGLYDGQDVRVGGRPVTAGRVGGLAAASLLIADRGVGALVMVADPGAVDSGLPFAQFDLLLLAGTEGGVGADREGRADAAAHAWARAHGALMEAWRPADAGAVSAVPGAPSPAYWAALAEKVLAIDRRYAQPLHAGGAVGSAADAAAPRGAAP